MQAPFRSFMIDLLAKSDHPVVGVSGEEYLKGDIEWCPYPIHDGIAGFSSLKMLGGLTLHHSRVQFDPLVQREPFVDFCHAKIDFTEPVLQIHCTLAGSVIRKDLLTGHEYQIEQDHAYISLASQASFTVAVSPEQEARSLHLTIGLSTLRELIGQQPVDTWCQQLQSQSDAVHVLGRAVVSPLQFCLDEDLPFVVRKLRTHARTLEFLSGLVLKSMEHDKSFGSSRPLANANTIRQYIRQHYRECVTLSDLAKAFGVTTRTINNILVRETGMPAARLMREQRLSLAHEMIQQTDMPMVELSARLGYRHLSNFSIAFKKLFGYAPNVLRQSEQAYRSPSLAGLRIPGVIDWKKN